MTPQQKARRNAEPSASSRSSLPWPLACRLSCSPCWTPRGRKALATVRAHRFSRTCLALVSVPSPSPGYHSDNSDIVSLLCLQDALVRT